MLTISRKAYFTIFWAILGTYITLTWFEVTWWVRGPLAATYVLLVALVNVPRRQRNRDRYADAAGPARTDDQA